ncbi:hypothetical protein [Micromonospora zamorensis]|uniref:hypothetical protein n=1 Tax=Micromonospora zamorensis TaxID=709883 RepID=UPI003F4D5C6E
MTVELADHPVERAQRGPRGEPDPEHRQPFVAFVGALAVPAPLGAVVVAGERVRDRGLAQPGQSVDHRGSADPVRVLAVGGDDLVEFVVDRGQLRGLDGAEVGVPVMADVVVVGFGVLAECGELPRRQWVGTHPVGSVGPAPPAFLARQSVERAAGHDSTSNASS